MNDKLLKQLVRQVKILNIFMAFFGVLIVVSIAVIGFMLYQMITFTQDAAAEVREFQQQTSEQLDIRRQACESEQLGGFLKSSSEVCSQP